VKFTISQPSQLLGVTNGRGSRYFVRHFYRAMLRRARNGIPIEAF